MHTDIVDLREFYLSGLGQAAQRLLRRHMGEVWPQIRGETVLALGYGVPLLRPWLQDAGSILAMMPASQGVAYWPREGPNLSCLIDAECIPLPDASVDRVVVMHGLEGAASPHAMLREIWRVMKSGGRMLAIVPNRRGLWAHSDATPFGNGEPYSASQIKDILRDHGFLADRISRALYMPPSQSRLLLSLADVFEKYGEKLFPGFGGLLLIEAAKQLYAPPLAKPRREARRMILPLPLPAAPQPVPSSRAVL
jgi:SAM-dependent methyltransferase